MSSRENKRNLQWGILLITFGITALMDTFTFGTDWLRVGVIALGGLIGLAVYLLDRSDWVLLIPPYILLVAAGISSLALSGYAEGEFFASFVLIMIALPFLYVFLRDRAQWWALIPSWVLLVISAIIAVEELGWIDDFWIATLILGSIGLPFLVVFLRNREQWWALIPFYIMASLALMIPLIDTHVIEDAWVATFILGAVALPFLVVYFRNRSNWWALIPAYVLLSIGLMVGLIDARVLRDLVIPGYIMLSIAIPFFFVYFVNREQRWALIPGSITGLMGLAFLVSGGAEYFEFVLPAALILLGLWVLFRAVKN
jgi:hypothetical protein